MNAILSLEHQIEESLGLHDLIPLKGGRTNRVWVSDDKVIKFFSGQGSTPLFGNSMKSEWIALKTLNGLGIAPDPIAKHQFEFGDLLIYRHIPGQLGASSVEDAARLLGRLHTFNPTSKVDLPRAPDVTQQGLAMLPTGHSLLRSKPSEIKPLLTSIVHRDPVFTNFISSPSGLWLVDWQCPCIGDPVEDIAHFISPAMNLLYRKDILRTAEISTFLESYPDAQTVENYKEYGQNYHWRMACYCAWQVSRGNKDYLPALEAETEFLSHKR